MTSICGHGGEPAVRKGPWTMEEDLILINHISQHGEGAWNNLARSAGLNRTGKSCRLRWLNYLKPGVRRGNISRFEDMLIRELHSTWGNRWSKIAKHLPGRTDNEIKNYWRTRIHKKPRAGNGEPRPYVHQNAVSVNEAPAASPSQLSSVEDGCVQWSYPELSMIATQQHETADVDAIPRQYFYSDFDNFWNVDGFWAAMPVLDAE